MCGISVVCFDLQLSPLTVGLSSTPSDFLILQKIIKIDLAFFGKHLLVNKLCFGNLVIAHWSRTTNRNFFLNEILLADLPVSLLKSPRCWSDSYFWIKITCTNIWLKNL